MEHRADAVIGGNTAGTTAPTGENLPGPIKVCEDHRLNSKPLAVLETARARIAAPGGWCQGAYARDASGQGADYLNSDAVCFCAMGAVLSTARDFSEPCRLLENAVTDLWGVLDDDSVCPVTAYNDVPGRTQEQVVAVFDYAIKTERLKSGE